MDNYLEAIAIIDTRIGVDSLFKLDPDDVADKNETTADLEEFKSAIQSDSYTMEDDDFEGDKKIINPNAFFAGKKLTQYSYPNRKPNFYPSLEISSPPLGGRSNLWWDFFHIGTKPISSKTTGLGDA